MRTYLRLSRGRVIVAVRGGAEGSAWSLVAGADASAFCQVLLTFRLSDLHLLLLATAAELLRLERVFCLELGPAMLRNVAVGHVCVWMGGVELVGGRGSRGLKLESKQMPVRVLASGSAARRQPSWG